MQHGLADATDRDARNDRRPRLVELDALRGFAALAVLVYHFTSVYPRLIAHRPFAHVPALDFGYFGVELFFIISGFVIFFTAQRARSIRDFALSRFARLFPVYWAAVIITVLVQVIGYRIPLATVAPQAVSNATMLQTFIGTANLDGSYWTLAFELSFYILIAGAIRVTLVRGYRIEWALLGWLSVATLIRALDLYIPYRLAVFGLLSYGQFFILGITLFLIYAGRASWLTIIVATWAITMSAFGADPHSPAAGFDSYFLGAASCAAIAIIALWYQPAILSSPVPQFFGAISYSLYLTHSTIGFLVLQKAMETIGNDMIAVCLAMIISVAVGCILNITIEKPGRLALARLLHLHRPDMPAIA